MSECTVQFVDDQGQASRPYRYRCDRCGIFESRKPPDKSHQIHRICRTRPAPAPSQPPCTGDCPGDELSAMTEQLGLQPKAGCQCEKIRRDMNEAGWRGCQLNRDGFLPRLKTNYAEHYSYRDLFAASRRARKKEAFRLLRKLRTLDANLAIERLFDEAIRRARAKAKFAADSADARGL